MKFTIYTLITILFFSLIITGCGNKQTMLTVSKESVQPGTSVTRNGEPLRLLGTPVRVGEPLPSSALVESSTMKSITLSQFRGEVLLISIVPSIDTKVCEEQTHYLGEEGDILASTVKRITISRDTPFAQRRFAEEAGLEDIIYLSDYKEGAFGKASGLLVDGPMLLARSVIIADAAGVVRYIQVVPELTTLPNMDEAFGVAQGLVE